MAGQGSNGMSSQGPEPTAPRSLLPRSLLHSLTPSLVRPQQAEEDDRGKRRGDGACNGPGIGGGSGAPRPAIAAIILCAKAAFIPPPGGPCAFPPPPRPGPGPPGPPRPPPGCGPPGVGPLKGGAFLPPGPLPPSRPAPPSPHQDAHGTRMAHTCNRQRLKSRPDKMV